MMGLKRNASVICTAIVLVSSGLAKVECACEVMSLKIIVL